MYRCKKKIGVEGIVPLTPILFVLFCRTFDTRSASHTLGTSP